MKKKTMMKWTAVAVAAITTLSLTAFAFADEGYRTETIGNVSYAISDSISGQETETDGKKQVIYPVGSGVTIVQYSADATENPDDQKAKVAEIADGFSAMPGYSESSSADLTFQNMPATIKSFSYQDGADEYVGKTYALYDGGGVVSFTFGYPADADDLETQESAFAKLTGSVKTKRVTDEMPETEAGETEAETEKPILREFVDGSYKVGSDVEVGEYLLVAPDGFGSVTVSEDEEKTSVKISKSFPDSAIVNLVEGDRIELTGASARICEPGQKPDFSKGGSFKAGIHFDSGTYSIVPIEGEGNGYFRIYGDTSYKSIKAEGPVSAETQVTVEDGNVLELTNCKFSEEPPAPAKEFTDKETVKKVQEALNAAGFECGKPDGVAGKKTKAALSKYATEKGLASGEKVTEELLDSLGVAH